VPAPVNEPVLGYLPGSPERSALEAELQRQSSRRIEIPLIIAGQEVPTGRTETAIVPHDHGHVLADVHQAGETEIEMAVDAAVDAHRAWSRMAWEERAAIFLRAAQLLAGPRRQRLNAATMLNQSKTCHQAEIDAACEMIDFFRFNAWYMQEIKTSSRP
jgi:1-pyrroline-5-carboxylate dehydrogenase